MTRHRNTNKASKLLTSFSNNALLFSTGLFIRLATVLLLIKLAYFPQLEIAEEKIIIEQRQKNNKTRSQGKNFQT